MSRTLIITGGKIADENGCDPPAGETENGLWRVSLIEGPVGKAKRSIWFRPNQETEWSLQFAFSDCPDVPQQPQPYHRQAVGTSTDGNWIFFDDESKLCIAGNVLEPDELEPAHSRAGKE